jgi:hypothetical protein
MEYLWAWGTLIHEKKLEVENHVSDSLQLEITVVNHLAVLVMLNKDHSWYLLPDNFY